MRTLSFIFSICLIFCGCSKTDYAPEAYEVQSARFNKPAEEPIGDEQDGAVASSETPALRRLIKTVDLRVQVEHTEATAEAVKALTAEIGGYVAFVSAERYGENMRYSLTIKVPVNRLEEAVSQLKAMAVTVNHESLSTQDVTDQFVDLEARLRTLAATETELQALLAEARSRDFKAADIMVVYERLTEIRGRSERLQGQLNQLSNQTSFSTVNIYLNPTESAESIAGEKWRPTETVRRSFRGLVSGLKVIIDFLIYLMIGVIPILAVILLPLVFLWRRFRSPKKKGGE